ncbi:MAG: hypothetical protein PQJ49_01105 [Sphaerochaetaceae bacterium]|nr:hypothetical protein [Sphaerochaetaceae bacterium]
MEAKDFELQYMQLPNGERLVSWHRHDYKTFEAGSDFYMIDGGQVDYIRYSQPEDWDGLRKERLEDCFNWVREEFTWTKRYDKDMNLLEKPVTAKLKDLALDHLLALVKYKEGSYMEHLFQMEINYRVENADKE